MSGLSKRQLSLRSDAIGASEIAALAGLSKWATPIEIFEAKLGIDHKEETLAMDLGIELEEPIARVHAKRTGKWLKRVDTIQNQRWPFAICTPDRAVFSVPNKELAPKKLLKLEDLSAAECLAQIKSTTWRSREDFGEPGTDAVSEAFLAAGQWEMGVSGVHRLDYVVLFDKDRLDVWHLSFNDDLFRGLYEIGAKFMVDHVRARRPPPPDSSEAYGEFLGRWFDKKKPGLIVEASDDLAQQILVYAKLKQAEKRLEKTLKGAAHWIQSQIGTNDGVAHRLFGKLTWKKTKDGSTTDWEAVANDALRIAGLALMGSVSEEGALEMTTEIEGLVAKHTQVKPGYPRMHAAWSGPADFKERDLALSLPVPKLEAENEETTNEAA